jgi:hypothetical protein
MENLAVSSGDLSKVFRGCSQVVEMTDDTSSLRRHNNLRVVASKSWAEQGVENKEQD